MLCSVVALVACRRRLVCGRRAQPSLAVGSERASTDVDGLREMSDAARSTAAHGCARKIVDSWHFNARDVLEEHCLGRQCHLTTNMAAAIALDLQPAQTAQTSDRHRNTTRDGGAPRHLRSLVVSIAEIQISSLKLANGSRSRSAKRCCQSRLRHATRMTLAQASRDER